MFSYGVPAISVTIMVLQIQVPDRPSLEALVPLVPVLLSYVLSFLYVGISPGSPTTTCCKRARK